MTTPTAAGAGITLGAGVGLPRYQRKAPYRMARVGFTRASDLFGVLWLATLGTTAGLVLGLAHVLDAATVSALITAAVIAPLTYMIGHSRGVDTAGDRDQTSTP